MCNFLYENDRGSLTLTSLNVLGVLGVLNVLNVLYVLNVLDMPMDASLACWALFSHFPQTISRFRIYSRPSPSTEAVDTSASLLVYLLVLHYTSPSVCSWFHMSVRLPVRHSAHPSI